MRLTTVPFAVSAALLISAGFIFGCQKNTEQTANGSITQSAKSAQNKCGQAYSCGDYQVTLDVDYVSLPGHTIFTWGITNPCPGNGSNGTVQDLSHWDFLPGQCLIDNRQNVVEASYNNGSGWQVITTAPTIQRDPSLQKGGCYGGDVFKFDQGTSGAATTYYRLVLTGNWETGDLTAIFKSGGKTGCCSKVFPGKGIGCPVEDDGGGITD